MQHSYIVDAQYNRHGLIMACTVVQAVVKGTSQSNGKAKF